MIVRTAVAVDDARCRVGAHAATAGGVILIAQAVDLPETAVVSLR